MKFFLRSVRGPQCQQQYLARIPPAERQTGHAKTGCDRQHRLRHFINPVVEIQLPFPVQRLQDIPQKRQPDLAVVGMPADHQIRRRDRQTANDFRRMGQTDDRQRRIAFRQRTGHFIPGIGTAAGTADLKRFAAQQGGSAPQTELTEFMRLKAPTVNGILGRMEEKELLLRLTDRQDGRRKLVVLTEKGKSLLEQTRQAFAEAEDVMRRGFTQAEAAQLQGLLERLRQNLKEDRDLW